MRTRLRLLLVGVLTCAVMLPAGVAAGQDEPLAATIRDSQFSEDGSVELVVNVTGSGASGVLDEGAFAVRENGQAIAGLAVEPLLEQAAADVAVTLLVDVSGSMAGEPMEVTREAASQLALQLTDDGIQVGLIAFGGGVRELTAPTANGDRLVELIRDLEADGETPLYDAVLTGVEQLAAVSGQRNLVVFSDGGDSTSEASLAEAAEAAGGAEIPAVIVAFETDDLDPDALERIAGESEGRVLMAEDVDDISGVFDTVAADLASQYVVTYTSELVEPSELNVVVSVTADDGSADVSFTVPNPREQAHVAPEPAIRTPSEPGFLAGDAALVVGAGGAFVALLLIFGLMFTGQRTRGDRHLGEQLASYLERGDKRAGRSGLVASHFRERAMALLESGPRPEGFDERLALRLEQAGWPLRNGEFLGMSLAAGLVTGVLVGLLANWVGGLLLAVVAAAIPWLVMEVRRSRRREAFLTNLPDTLQLLAGSLRAGYGIMQAIDTVAREAPEPTSEEFQRVITEARLGLPVEDALEMMAERVDSEDFRWVVLAINIQREVGGNLAELLDAVAETLREREMLRRQIKVLSAEGRLSAVVLIALPIVLTIYLIVVRPEYISTLVTSGLLGWLMVVGASMLMGVGVLWIRKLIQIEV